MPIGARRSGILLLLSIAFISLLRLSGLQAGNHSTRFCTTSKHYLRIGSQYLCRFRFRHAAFDRKPVDASPHVVTFAQRLFHTLKS